jgi:aspartyl-tRNA(Asn)/glutamyl-tRNA(Gln) amidotransferase subunit B
MTTDDEIYASNIEALAVAMAAQVLELEDMRILAELLGLKKQTGNQFEPQIDSILAENPDKVKEYQGGKTKLIGFFVGQLMKQNKGADPKVANEMFAKKLLEWPVT